MPDSLQSHRHDIRTRALVALGELLRNRGYAFVTITPESHRAVLARAPETRETTLRDVFGWNREFDAATLGDDVRQAMIDAGVLVRSAGGHRSAVRFATFRDEIFVHSAFPTVDTDAVFFGPDTYRFLSFLEREGTLASHVVDVGSGSGAAGIVASRHARVVTLADINARALEYARVNVALARAPNVAIVESDVLAGVHQEIDLVVSNPPFMRDPLGRSYRDGGGGHGEGLSVRIAKVSLARLREGGKLLLYTGSCIIDGRDTFLEAVSPHLKSASSVRYEELDPDIFGESLREEGYGDVDRIAAVGLVVTK